VTRAGLMLVALASVGALADCGSQVVVTPVCSHPVRGALPDQFHRDVSLLTLPYGLQYADITIGCGEKVQPGDQVTMDYTGWLSDGSQFDSSTGPGRQPFVFPLGEQQVIRGVDFGVMGMRVGGQRRIVVPSALAYGPQGIPSVVPANATVTFDVQVLSVRHANG